MELPQEIKNDIFLKIDPSMEENFSNELQKEYHLFSQQKSEKNSNNKDNISFDLSDIDLDLMSKKFKPLKLNLIKFTYEIKDILSYKKYNKEQSYKLLGIFNDEFLENIFIFYIKSLIKYNKRFYKIKNQYFKLIYKLIKNNDLRYKILDLFWIIVICDKSCINKINKDTQIIKNSLVNSLNILYSQKNFIEDYLFCFYYLFFNKFSINYEKEMDRYFI